MTRMRIGSSRAGEDAQSLHVGVLQVNPAGVRVILCTFATRQCLRPDRYKQDCVDIYHQHYILIIPFLLAASRHDDAATMGNLPSSLNL